MAPKLALHFEEDEGRRRYERSRRRDRAVHEFSEGYVTLLGKRSREGDMLSFYKHTKGPDVGRERSFAFQNIKHEDGKLVRDPAHIHDRGTRWFHKILAPKSLTLNPRMAEQVKQWPRSVPLDDIPSTFGVEHAIQGLTNRRKRRPD